MWVSTLLSIMSRSYHEGYFFRQRNQYIQWVNVLYCKLLTIGKQLPTFLIGSEV